jgi:hypothetical protein
MRRKGGRVRGGELREFAQGSVDPQWDRKPDADCGKGRRDDRAKVGLSKIRPSLQPDGEQQIDRQALKQRFRQSQVAAGQGGADTERETENRGREEVRLQEIGEGHGSLVPSWRVAGACRWAASLGTAGFLEVSSECPPYAHQRIERTRWRTW